MKVMIDNVAVQAVERCLVSKIPKFLTTETIHGMDDELVERIAAESASDQVIRKETQQHLKALDAALLICRRYATGDASRELHVI